MLRKILNLKWLLHILIVTVIICGILNVLYSIHKTSNIPGKRKTVPQKELVTNVYDANQPGPLHLLQSDFNQAMSNLTCNITSLLENLHLNIPIQPTELVACRDIVSEALSMINITKTNPMTHQVDHLLGNITSKTKTDQDVMNKTAGMIVPVKMLHRPDLKPHNRLVPDDISVHDGQVESMIDLILETSSESEDPIHIVPDNTKCNVTHFLQQTRRPISTSLLNLKPLSSCQRVIYNRVPKCASRTMRDVFAGTADLNRYSHIFLDTRYHVTGKTKDRFMDAMHASGHQFVLTSHFFFTNFSDLYSDSVAYVNVIRDPVDWFQSLYFWLLYGSKESPKRTTTMTVQGTETIDECVVSEDCVNKLRAVFGPLHFFCGISVECGRNSSYALTQALKHIHQYYIVVGVFEDLAGFVEVLEYLIPRMFRKMSSVFSDIGTRSANATKTVKRQRLDPSLKQQLKEKLHLEYKFYNNVLTNFQRLQTTLRYMHTT